jgi:hypothetical protein
MTSKLPPASYHGAEAGISRRGFIQGMVVVSATTVALNGLPVAAGEIPETAATAGLSAEHHRLLALVLNRIIPAEGAMPAAGDLGIATFIEQVVKAAPHLRSPITEVLDALPDANEFSQLSETAAERFLHHIEEGHGGSFDLFVQATYAGYYGHSEVQKILGWIDPVDAG